MRYSNDSFTGAKKKGILYFSYNMVIRTHFLLGEAILSRMLIVDAQGVADIKTVIFFSGSSLCTTSGSANCFSPLSVT